MKVNLTVYGQVEINGGRITHDLGHGEIRNQLASLARWMIDLELDSRSFSSLTFKLSKNPIQSNDDPWIALLDDHTIPVNHVQDSDPIDGFPDITWGEFGLLSDDPDWTNALVLSRSSDRTQYTGADIDRIRANFHAKFHGSKFWKLIGDKL